MEEKKRRGTKQRAEIFNKSILLRSLLAYLFCLLKVYLWDEPERIL